jgi:glucose dehydrogenase
VADSSRLDAKLWWHTRFRTARIDQPRRPNHHRRRSCVIAGTTDSLIRAFNVETGEELWRATLPAAGNAAPMTYEMNGKPYIVIAAGGHQRIPEEPLGDSLVAFAFSQ